MAIHGYLKSDTLSEVNSADVDVELCLLRNTPFVESATSVARFRTLMGAAHGAPGAVPPPQRDEPMWREWHLELPEGGRALVRLIESPDTPGEGT